MDIAKNTPTAVRRIGNKTVGFDVNVPMPFSAGPIELTEGQASALNQVLAENLSNNLRAKLVSGQTDEAGNVTGPHDEASAQALVDEYIAEYEMGVRKSGSGEPRVADPIEREARKLARAAAVSFVKEQGMKAKDVDMVPIVDQIFAANRDTLMTEAKKIVNAASKTQEGINLGGITIAAKTAE